MTMLHRTSLSFGPAAPAAAGENTENTYEFYFTTLAPARPRRKYKIRLDLYKTNSESSKVLYAVQNTPGFI